MRKADEWGEARVVAIRDVAADIREFQLSPQGGAAAYPSGAHLRVRVQLADGRWELRHYSLIGAAPRDGAWRIAVKRESPGRGGSRWMHALNVGATLDVAAPASHFELSPACSSVLLIAGGIGVTPLVGMAERLVARGAAVRMIQAARGRDGLAYGDELAALLGDGYRASIDDEGARIDFAAAFAALPADGECYVCGPAGMMAAARDAWHGVGRAADRLRFETFGGTGGAARAFTVRLPALGREVEVPADASMLDALERAGVEMLADCRRGECGLCAVDVLDCDSTIEHRDVFFSAEQHAEGKRICACVSRADGGTLSIDTYWRPAA